MKKKTLILIPDRRYFWSYAENNNIYDIYETYSKQLFAFSRCLKKKYPSLTYVKFGILGKWSKHMHNYNKIIIFDSAYSTQINHIIRKCNSNIDCYFFHWNKINTFEDRAKKILNSIAKQIKLYSFNKTDCLKWGVEYNTTLYYPLKNITLNTDLIYDICFLGLLKPTRQKALEEIVVKLQTQKLKLWIYVVGDNNSSSILNIKTEGISYEEYLKYVMRSTAILDIYDFAEENLTLRTMEAIFYNKKYITNNPNIKKENFYSPQNIFIIGIDDESKLKNFLTSETIPVDKTIKETYLLENWIKRFK